jgi:amino acid adenylation domain-containing protein
MLPRLEIQYADYAHWQRETLASSVFAGQLEYWKQQLAGAPPALELPADWQRPAVETSSGAWLPIRISASLTHALEELSRREGVTLFMTLLAAFQTLLHRYTGGTDIVVGSPIAGRTRRETELLIGFFANTLVLRGDLSGDPTFREMLTRVREVATGAYAHEDVPFEKLVEAINPARDLTRHPIFQVMFALQNTRLETPSLPGLQAELMDVDPGTAMFDLNLFLERADEGLKGLLEYNTDLFARATMVRMAGHFETLLGGIVQHPDERLSRLPLLTEAECHQLVVEWNDTRFEYPPAAALHALIEAQCARTPDATALVFENTHWTFAKLNREANRWAHRLRKLGVGPDVIIGICAERSLELVAGLLGILKAGGAYLPLDPSYPRERLAFMLGDAKPRIVLVQERLAAELPQSEAHVLHLDGIFDDEPEAGNPACENTPDDLAYVIYTSGSTGWPKGVMNTHRGISNRLLWMQRAYALTSADAVMQKTPFSFDVSVWEFFWPLLAGARLVLARPDGHRDAAYLIALIQSERITTMHFVPSMLSAFLDVPGLERCASLRRVICSGEALSCDLQERFFAKSHAELHNLYGPTEASVDVSFWACQRGTARHSVPIGRPIDNTQLYVLDAQLQPVPIGVAGELHIGGIGLARGYLNRPELTAERFIPDPFNAAPGARLYKTGDVARFLANGAIEFLGRRDHQVKLRGFRVELGEIEAALLAQPGIRKAVAVVREHAGGDLRISACVVGERGHVLDPAALRDALRRALPEYMVPAHFVALDDLPLTPSGKIDRNALPSRATAEEEPALPPAAPAGEPVEGHLQRLWAELLGVRNVTASSNFFDLGGHSLLAVRMFSEIERRLGLRMPVSAIYQAPTVAQLAAAIRANPPETERRTGLITVQPHGTRRPIFWMPSVRTAHNAWEGIGLADYLDLAKHLPPDQPSYTFAPPEPFDDPHRLAKYCERLLRQVQPHGPYIVAGYCLAAESAYELVRRLVRRGEAIEAFMIFEGYAPTNRYSLAVLPGDSLQSKTRRRLSKLFRMTPATALHTIRRRIEVILHKRALREYAREPFQGRAVLFRSDEELSTHRIDLGWNDLIEPAPEVIMLPAGHHGMLRDPVSRLVAAEMLRRLGAPAAE